MNIRSVSAAENRPGSEGFNRTMPPSTVIPELVYGNVGEAIGWLCDKFGFEVRWQAEIIARSYA